MWKYGSQLLHIYGILQKIEKKILKPTHDFCQNVRHEMIKKREKIFNVCASVSFFLYDCWNKFDETAPLQKNGLKKLIVKQNELFEAKCLKHHNFSMPRPLIYFAAHIAEIEWMITLPTF